MFTQQNQQKTDEERDTQRLATKKEHDLEHAGAQGCVRWDQTSYNIHNGTYPTAIWMMVGIHFYRGNSAVHGRHVHGPIADMPCGASRELRSIPHRHRTLSHPFFAILFISFCFSCWLIQTSLGPPLCLTLTATAYSPRRCKSHSHSCSRGLEDASVFVALRVSHDVNGQHCMRFVYIFSHKIDLFVVR